MKKLYLTVNPFGGHKKGPRILKEVLPLFEKNNFDLTIIETEYAGHNKQLAMDVDMTDYDGFCCIGGFGGSGVPQLGSTCLRLDQGGDGFAPPPWGTGRRNNTRVPVHVTCT